jgi:hypothetical protein
MPANPPLQTDFGPVEAGVGGGAGTFFSSTGKAL